MTSITATAQNETPVAAKKTGGWLRWAIVPLFLGAVLLGTTRRASAATLTVTSNADTNTPGDGTLRTQINAAADGDTINFQTGLTGPINLTNGEIALNKNLTITGPGAAALTVSGTNNSRIFNLNNGQSLAISGLTLTAGKATGNGGAIVFYDNNTLALTDVTISGSNATGNGGAIYGRYNNTVTLQKCTVSGNIAAGNGGGIRIKDNSNLALTTSNITGNTATAGYGGGGALYYVTTTITSSTIMGNTASTQGGGVSLRGRSTTITNSTISGNTSSTNGGGISQHYYAPLNIINSTISNNTATTGKGGGLYDRRGTLSISGSTLSGNTAGTSGGAINFYSGNPKIQNSTLSGNKASVDGGAIYFYNGSRGNIRNCTISGNTADSDSNGSGTGGGLRVYRNYVSLQSTIVAKNVHNFTSPVPDDFSGNGYGSANNVIGVDTGLINISNGSNGNQVGTAAAPIDPLLNALANNGGPTQTESLQVGSPAIAHGSNPDQLLTDQRGSGFQRSTFGATDAGAFQSQGKTLIVTNTNDSGTGSLRDAVQTVNGTPGTSAVLFQAGLNGTIKLTTGELPVSNNVKIFGPGSATLGVDGNHASRVIDINAPFNTNVSISGLTISGGSVTGEGGGILTSNGNHTLSLSKVVLSGNTATIAGGGLRTRNAKSVTISNSSIVGNASIIGGGVANDTGITITKSTISGNSGDLRGGGLALVAGTSYIQNSTVSNNTSPNGAGLYSKGALFMYNSTLSGNAASGNGGALNINSGSLTVTDSTVSGNSAGSGGGLWNNGASQLNNSTVALNSASAGAGGGIFENGGSLNLRSTIVAQNSHAGAPDDVAGAATGSNNLIGADGTLTGITNLDVNNNQVGTTAAPIDPKLAPLASNGGPTQTQALLSGSPAKDKGSNPLSLTTDQRGTGFPRVSGLAADVGAFETSDAPQSFVVNSTLDPVDAGKTTLRDAINSANALQNTNDTITFDPTVFATAQTIALASNLPVITDSVTITGPGAALATVDGGTTRRLFQLTPSNATTPQLFNISGITLTKGSGTSGAIHSSSNTNVTVANAVLKNNHATGYGGAIGVYAGNVTVSGTTISGNTANRDGGGIELYNGVLSVSGSTITGNSSNSEGGGLYSDNSTISIQNSNISGNHSSSGGGGIKGYRVGLSIAGSTINNNTSSGEGAGLYASGRGNSVDIANSTFSGNSANSGGGGLKFYNGEITLQNLVISNNSSTGRGGGLYMEGRTLASVQSTTITGNTAKGRPGGGGVYLYHGNTTISNSTISNNTSLYAGGGLGGSRGTVAVTNCTITGNTASGTSTGNRGRDASGGGIKMDRTDFSMAGSTVSSNTSALHGAGVSLYNVTSLIKDSTIAGNTSAKLGGGLYDRKSAVSVVSSTINGNTATSGGGVYNKYARLFITNSTISTNTAGNNGGGISNYGSASSDTQIHNSTIVNNVADNANGLTGLGGGIYVKNGPLTLISSLVAKNTHTPAVSASDDVSGTVNAASSNNLIGDGTGQTGLGVLNANQIGTAAAPIDPKIGALASNGGPTQTHAILQGSPAIDTGSNPDLLTTDQRGTGYPRVTGAGPDIGAFENSLPIITSGPSAVPTTGTTGQTIAFFSGASDQENDTLAFNWDFGDGSIGSGANTTHVYTAPGTYTVTLSVSEGPNAKTIGTLSIVITAAAPVVGIGTDTDADGFSDAVELAFGTNPKDPTSTPIGKKVTQADIQTLTLAKLLIKLIFSKTGNDGIMLQGTLPVPAGFKVVGQKVGIMVDGVVQVVTLDAKGHSPKGNNFFSIAIKSKQGVVAAQTAKFTAKLSKGSFASLLTDAGLTNATVKNKPVTVPVWFIFNNTVYQKNVAQKYTATINKTGMTK
jgi:parallel beta-helix repeat protein/predicted outer membrane repeat protein